MSAPLFPDLLLDVHEPTLNPHAELYVGAYRVGVQEFGESCFDLLVDLAQFLGVFDMRLCVDGMWVCGSGLSWNRARRVAVGFGRPGF